MDAREGGESQSHRSSIKRPWDEDPVPPSSASLWTGRGLSLPPIDIAPLSRAAEIEDNLQTRYGSESREVGGIAKRPRYEQHDYSSLSRENLDLNGKILQTQASAHSIYNPPRNSQELPSLWPGHRPERWGTHFEDPGQAAGARETSSLCQQCRRLTTPHQDQDFVESCEVCASEEVKMITLQAAESLSKLHKQLGKRNSGVRELGQRNLIAADCPPIEQVGLKHTLNWLLGAIYQINDLAEKFVQHVPPENSHNHGREDIKPRIGAQDVLADIMKRHIDPDSDDVSRSISDAVDPASDARLHTRRRSIASSLTNNEDFHSMRSPHGYHGGHIGLDGQNQRVSIMNPPPAPSRQLPSPPGRSLPSPTSINLPSPSTGSYGISSNTMNLPPPSGLHQSSLNTHLPPFGPTHSPDALQAHSAALQHEVSVQKIALASLQGEHNKLLAAFSRSQTRASALEKKHQVSDTEIISLTEEKLRLQSQVTELEKDVEQLARSRDEYRQSAVQEGAQYVEMIKKASRLEEMADEERKSWGVLKAEMEQRIESLTSRNHQHQRGMISPTFAIPLHRAVDDFATPPSSIEGYGSLKAEPTIETQPTSYPGPPQESDMELKEEIRRLRNRCAEAEDALRAVRDDSRNMEGIVEALGLAGKSIMERADRTLGNVPRIDGA